MPHVWTEDLSAAGLGVRVWVRQWSVFVVGWLMAVVEGSAREAGIGDELLIAVTRFDGAP